MRYDEERRTILISVAEMVGIARRGISRALPLDEDEPGHLLPSRGARSRATGGADGVPLRYPFEALGYMFELCGEADMIEGGEVTHIAAIKSSPERPRREEESEARGEGFILAYMYLMIEGLEEVTLNTVYINENSGDSATRVEKIGKNELERFFEKCAREVAKYARPEVDRVTVRMPSMKALKFPYESIREGQGDMVRATYRALARGVTLYASAPTGTGKTVSALYPAVKLVGEGKHEKVFYLTPKTTTAEVAADCIKRFAEGGAVIRAIVLTSKERSCQVGLSCRKSRTLCKLAECNNLKDATLKLYDMGLSVVTIGEVMPIAKEFSICPYELELSYSELCDVIICDINYLFDPRAYIRRFFEDGGRYSFLIDEAHNLAERAREMYSAEMTPSKLIELAKSQLFDERSEIVTVLPEMVAALEECLMPALRDELRRDKDGNTVGAAHLSEIPSRAYTVIEDIMSLIDGELKRSYRMDDEMALERTEVIREMYYDVKRVYDTMLAFDDRYKMFLFFEGERLRFKLFAVDPGGRIRDRLERGSGAVFFSATLSPIEYYKEVLGGDRSSEMLEVGSPFVPECLSVSIMDKISTRYSERERTVPAIARVIAATLSARRGNYMVFLPSFEYLDIVERAFTSAYPKIRALVQRKDMTSREKAEFLDEFNKEDGSYLVGFCVLGGIYSEGVDLVGDKLIGAVVVGIGLPSLSYEREAMTEYYEERFEQGKQYAYIYPGMNRVLQAAGRVIREENDRGVIVLIDDRFDDPIYKKAIPELWRTMEYVEDAKGLNERIKEFWAEVDKERDREGK